MILVDKLFDYFFLEKFSEEGQIFLSGIEYCEAIKAKIEAEPIADNLSEKAEISSEKFSKEELPASQ